MTTTTTNEIDALILENRELTRKLLEAEARERIEMNAIREIAAQHGCWQGNLARKVIDAIEKVGKQS